MLFRSQIHFTVTRSGAACFCGTDGYGTDEACGGGCTWFCPTGCACDTVNSSSTGADAGTGSHTGTDTGSLVNTGFDTGTDRCSTAVIGADDSATGCSCAINGIAGCG